METLMSIDENRLRKAVVVALRIKDERYRPDLKLGDLDEWDSLGHLDLIAQIEQEFGVILDIDVIPELTSLSALRAHLGSLA